MKPNPSWRMLGVTSVVLGILSLLPANPQDSPSRTNQPAPLHHRQFIIDVLNNLDPTNGSNRWALMWMIAERLETNQACHAYLVKEPKRVFQDLPVELYRSSHSPLLFNEAWISILRFNTRGAEMSFRVVSQDGADDLVLYTAGGTNQYLTAVKNQRYSYSEPDPPDQEIEWIHSPMPEADRLDMATNLFWRLMGHYRYQRISLLAPQVGSTNAFLWDRTGDTVERKARYPFWTVHFHCMTNPPVLGEGQPTNDVPVLMAWFSFAYNATEKKWMPTLLDFIPLYFYAAPKDTPNGPLIELAATFLEPNWAEVIYDSYQAPNAVQQAIRRFFDSAHRSRTLQKPAK